MVYIEIFDEFQRAVEELYAAAPNRVGAAAHSFLHASSRVLIERIAVSDAICYPISTCRRNVDFESHRWADGGFLSALVRAGRALLDTEELRRDAASPDAFIPNGSAAGS
jgi:hypothetical protein